MMTQIKEKRNKYLKEFAQKRREQHLCISCGVETNGKYYYCTKCAHKRRNRAKSDADIKRRKGLCIQCGRPNASGAWRCQSCTDSNSLRRMRLYEQRLAEGLCFECGKYPHMDMLSQRKFCNICYFKHASGKNMNSTKYWKPLLSILESQNYTCPYSGEKIVLGQNDSIDHILPRSRFPALVDDISNIQWVTRHVNHMKWDMTHGEFVETLKQMYLYCICV